MDTNKYKRCLETYREVADGVVLAVSKGRIFLPDHFQELVNGGVLSFDGENKGRPLRIEMIDFDTLVVLLRQQSNDLLITIDLGTFKPKGRIQVPQNITTLLPLSEARVVCPQAKDRICKPLVFNMATNKQLLSLPEGEWSSDKAFTFDTYYATITSPGDRFVVFEVKDNTTEMVADIKLQEPGRSLQMLPSGKIAIGRKNSGSIDIYDFETGRREHTIEHSDHPSAQLSLMCLLDDQKFASIINKQDGAEKSFDYTIKVWSLNNYSCIKTVNVENSEPKQLYKLGDNVLSVQATDDTVKVFSLETGRKLHQWHATCVRALGPVLFVSGEDGEDELVIYVLPEEEYEDVEDDEQDH